jgi:hypothetical protein
LNLRHWEFVIIRIAKSIEQSIYKFYPIDPFCQKSSP